jgi:2-oxoisovalerate dehydrogenase E2 component (dihydrolipoyl transacylase)
VEEGQMATAKDPIAILTDSADEAYEDQETPYRINESPQQKVLTPSPTPAIPKKAAGTIAAMPAARTLAKELGVDLNQVRGTGPGGLITVKDVRAAIAKTEDKAITAARTQRWLP